MLKDPSGCHSDNVALIHQKVGCGVCHASGKPLTTDAFRKLLKKSGYYAVKSTMEFVARINTISVPKSFYANTDRWHVTLGDSDQDR